MKPMLFFIAYLSCLLTSCIHADDSGPLFPVKEKGKWGFVNNAGKMVIEPQYESCFYQFAEGLAPVDVDGCRNGYIDRNNKMVIAPQWSGAESFRDGLAAVGGGNPYMYGYIDKTGQYILKPDKSYSYWGFSDGLMLVREGGRCNENGKWGYIDRTGRMAIPYQFADAEEFSSGLAGVVGADGTTGYINTKGNWVIRLESAYPYYEGFSEGLAPVRERKSGNYGYINTNGTFVIAPQFEDAGEFHEGRAAVRIAKKDKSGWPIYKWGAIDVKGNIVVPLKYKHMRSYEEGMAKVVDDEGSGFVNLEGEETIPCTFANVEPFRNGLALVQVGDNVDFKSRWMGYINKKGEFVWRPSNYKELDKIRAKVVAEKKNRKPTVLLFSNEDTKEKGILVTCPKEIPLKGQNAGQVPIEVINLLEEEVFLEVTGFESLHYSLELWGDGYASGGGNPIVFPDNTQQLKRLYASSYSDNKRISCGCCSTRIMGQLDKSVLELGRARGTVDVQIRGFYRNTGKRFSESIKLPIELLDDLKSQQ